MRKIYRKYIFWNNLLKISYILEEDSELSDWSDDDEVQIIPNFSFTHVEESNQLLPKFEKKPVTHLPGVKEPLKPPETISDFENCDMPWSPEAAQEWISENLMPPYWLEESDSKALKAVVEVTNPMPDAHYVNIIGKHIQ